MTGTAAASAVVSPRPTAGQRVSGVLLSIGAALGVACVLAVLAAWWFGISIILFRTGSMSPTIPAGSAALVREVPAGSVAVGDVVTVARENALPITHRVRSVRPLGDGSTELVLRGDANASDDPAPYRVTTVRTVLLSVPGVAAVIVWFGNPLVLAGVTLAASALVLWAFWPRRTATEPAELAEPAEDEPAEDAPVGPGDDDALVPGLR